MKEEKNKDSPTGTWEWVDPDMVSLEGPYQCPNCEFRIGIDSTYLDQDSKVVVCPNCETEAPVPDSARAKHIKRDGKAEMMVWCEAAGRHVEGAGSVSELWLACLSSFVVHGESRVLIRQ